jgi:micrococcal nuclease
MFWLDGVMFNKTLLTEGHAVLATYPPNVRYVDEFTELQTQARNDGKGLWSDTVYE